MTSSIDWATLYAKVDHDAVVMTEDTDEASAPPTLTVVPPEPEPVVETEPTAPEDDTGWGGASAVVEKVLQHVTHKELATALVKLREAGVLPLDSGLTSGYFSKVMQYERDIEARETARSIYERKRAAGNAEPFDLFMLEDIPEEEQVWRVEGLLSSGGNMLLAAQYKTGKTTLLLNLAHSLITGEPFLGRFAVEKVAGRVAFLNFELPAAQFKRWGTDAGIPTDSLLTVHLRGRRNPFGVPDDLKRLGEALQAANVEVLFIDPFANAFTDTNQNDATEVGQWWDKVQRWCSTYGIREFIVATHAGHDGERMRGSSALGDKPDVILTMTRPDKSKAARYLSALGRDIEVEQDRLDFDPETKRLTLAGTGGVAGEKADSDVARLVEIVTENEGISTNKLVALWNPGGSEPNKKVVSAASHKAERAGLVVITPGPYKARLHYPAPIPATTLPASWSVSR